MRRPLTCNYFIRPYFLHPKPKLIDLGTNLEYFHAAEDRQAVRNEVFEIIHNLDNIRADSVVVEKQKQIHRFVQSTNFIR